MRKNSVIILLAGLILTLVLSFFSYEAAVVAAGVAILRVFVPAIYRWRKDKTRNLPLRQTDPLWIKRRVGV